MSNIDPLAEPPHDDTPLTVGNLLTYVLGLAGLGCCLWAARDMMVSPTSVMLVFFASLCLVGLVIALVRGLFHQREEYR